MSEETTTQTGDETQSTVTTGPAPAAKKAAPKKAAPKKAAKKKAAPKKAAKPASENSVDGVFIKTKTGLDSFRRAGFKFNKEGIGIALDALSDDQLAMLDEEENLVVEFCTFTDTDNVIK